MKKRSIIALLLVMSLLFSVFLFSCKKTPAADDEGTSPASSPANSPANSPDASPANSPAEPDESGQKLFGADETIEMVYLSYALGIGWCMQVADAFQELGPQFNINVEIADGNFTPETQLNQLEQYLAKGVDVVACMLVDPGAARAVTERCKEAGVLFLGETAGVMDENGILLAPCDWLHGYEVGQKETQWVIDNYERLGFDYSDLSTVGLLYITDTMFVEMAAREDATLEVWNAHFPDFPQQNIFKGDRSADSGSNMEAGYNQTASIISANPQIKQWVIVSFQEDYASGACRAVEDLNLVDQTLLVSAGGENVIPEWDNGLTKPWYAACYFTGYDSAIIVLEAANKILREGVAPEDVYPNKGEGQTYGYDTFSGEMITFEDYKSLIG